MALIVRFCWCSCLMVAWQDLQLSPSERLRFPSRAWCLVLFASKKPDLLLELPSPNLRTVVLVPSCVGVSSTHVVVGAETLVRVQKARLATLEEELHAALLESQQKVGVQEKNPPAIALVFVHVLSPKEDRVGGGFSTHVVL